MLLDAWRWDPGSGRSPLVLRLGVGASVALTLAVALLPIFFAHPMGDDFCNVSKVREYGVLETVWREYMGWGGRWSTHFFAVGFPAVFEISRAYWLGLAAALSLQAVAVWFLLSGVLSLREEPRLAWTLTLGLLALQWAGLPHPGQSVYFLEGIWVYSLNLSLGMLLLGCLVRLSHRAASPHPMVLTGLLALALFAAAAHELFAVLLTGLLGVGALLCWWQRDPRGFAWLAASVGAVVGLVTVVAAPGNETREAAESTIARGDIGRTISAATWMALRILDEPVGRGARMGRYSALGWLTDPRLLAATVLFVAAAPVQRLAPAWLAAHERVWKTVVPVVWIGALAGSLVAGAWALGRTLPLRAFNGLYWVFLLGWFLTAFVYTRSSGTSAAFEPTRRLLLTASAVVFSLGLLVSTNTKHVVRDFAKGSFSHFDQSMQARHAEARRVREAGERALWVDPIEPWPETYFRVDIADTQPPLQRCAADYFRVDEIRTRGSRPR